MQSNRKKGIGQAVLTRRTFIQCTQKLWISIKHDNKYSCLRIVVYRVPDNISMKTLVLLSCSSSSFITFAQGAYKITLYDSCFTSTTNKCCYGKLWLTATLYFRRTCFSGKKTAISLFKPKIWQMTLNTRITYYIP